MDFEMFICFVLGAIACMLCPLTIYVLQIRDILSQLLKKRLGN